MDINLFFKIFKRIVVIACTIATVYLSVECIIEYIKDNDNSTVTFKNFHQLEDHLYPSISLCLMSGLFRTGYREYQDFLSGCQYNLECKWNALFSRQDYDAITKNLKNYVIGEITTFENGASDIYVYKKSPNTYTNLKEGQKLFSGYRGGKRVYTSRRKWNQKCLTFDMPFVKGTKIKYHSILLNNSVFPGKTRPKLGFEIFFHYPNQTIRQTSSKSSWTRDKTLLSHECDATDDEIQSCSYYGSTYTMNFDIDNVSVFKRRNKRMPPCLENWRNDDVEMKSLIAKRLDCKPAHWYLNLNLTNCTTPEAMNQSLLVEERPYIHSCCNIERYSFSYTEMAGLQHFDIGKQAFIDLFNINWDNSDINKETLSEISINFAGMN